MVNRGVPEKKCGQVNASHSVLHFRAHVMFSVAGFRPAGEALFFLEKAPKPLTPRLASWERRNARLRGAEQLAEPVHYEGLKQGPPVMRASLLWASQQASKLEGTRKVGLVGECVSSTKTSW